MSSPRMKFGTVILHTVMEGIMSQNFNLGLSFDFIDFRKNYFKISYKVTGFFLNIIKTKPSIKKI